MAISVIKEQRPGFPFLEKLEKRLHLPAPRFALLLLLPAHDDLFGKPRSRIEDLKARTVRQRPIPSIAFALPTFARYSLAIAFFFLLVRRGRVVITEIKLV